MNVSGVGSPNPYSQVAVNSSNTVTDSPVQESAQVLLLKKLLDAQRQQSADLLKQFDGKGRVLDIRV